jgi:hypothetical protein
MPKLSEIIQRGAYLPSGPIGPYLAPGKQQQRELVRLLKQASGTAFGRYYRFKDLLREENPVAAFQAAVPIFDYNRLFDQWWHISLGGVPNITWKGKVTHFAMSSGTAGAPSKHIPVTKDMMRAMRRASMRMLFNLPRFGIPAELYTKQMLMLGGSTSLSMHGDCHVGDLSGINAGKLPRWFRPFYKPGAEIAGIRDWNQRIEEIARRAPDWDIGYIAGIPSWLQLTLEKVIEYHGLQTIHDIWPNLSVFAHGGIHFEPYKKSFERLLARPLIYMDTYLASEGFIAFQQRPGTNAMKLILNNGIFLEFVPFDDQHIDEAGQVRPGVTALSIREVEENRPYALLLSTCAGAWRYQIGDTIRFTDVQRSEIVITGRTRHCLSVCGEHLSVENMNSAIEQLEKTANVAIPEFTAAAVPAGTHWRHRWYLGCDPLPLGQDNIAQILDEALKKVNDDYTTERKSTLQSPEIHLLPVSLFFQWQEAQGKMGGQYKFPRVMQSEQLEYWEAYVEQNKPHR